MSRVTRIPVTVIGGGIIAKWLSDAIQNDCGFEHAPLDQALIVFDAGTLLDDGALRRKALEAGQRVVALIPLTSAPPVFPTVNIDSARALRLAGLTSSLAQAAVPLVNAVSTLVRVDYAEAVGHIATNTFDTGDRAHLDELVTLTAKTLVSVGGAQRAKASLLVSSCVPPVGMRVVVHCVVAEPFDAPDMKLWLTERLKSLDHSVGAFRLRALEADGQMVTVRVGIESNSANTPYAGNLEILTTTAFHLARFMVSCTK